MEQDYLSVKPIEYYTILFSLWDGPE